VYPQVRNFIARFDEAGVMAKPVEAVEAPVAGKAAPVVRKATTAPRKARGRTTTA
jgi:hypothetical protein